MVFEREKAGLTFPQDSPPVVPQEKVASVL